MAVNSGTAALNIALSLIDIKEKEVILPSLSFVSTANCILKNGGKPIFVDIEPNTLCIDPEKIENSITSKTACILPVHFGGIPANLSKILRICKKYKLWFEIAFLIYLVLFIIFILLLVKFLVFRLKNKLYLGLLYH